MHTPYHFNPDRVAYFEKAGWEAYYNRQWLRLLTYIVQLNREQFGMRWFDALRAARQIVQASVAFAPVDNNIPKAQEHLERYYAYAQRAVGLHTPPAILAQLEMDYWVIHRQLAVARAQDPSHANHEPMVQALVKLHAALFDAPMERLIESAEQRALAAITVDLITSRRSTDVAGDWQRIEQCLRQTYRAVSPGLTTAPTAPVAGSQPVV